METWNKGVERVAFSPDQPVRLETVGYVKGPSLKDKIHCVAFVVDASKVLTYPNGLSNTFQKLREHISELGVHQVALLTHIDKICVKTKEDVAEVYKSDIVGNMMGQAAALLGMSTSYIVPVRNYSSELDLDVHTDVLLLSAVDHILQYANLYFQDNTAKHTGKKTSVVQNFCIPQLVPVDEACPFVSEDIRNIYKSSYIQDIMQEVGVRLGVSMSCVVPVKNYSREFELDQDCDILLLTALIQMCRSIGASPLSPLLQPPLESAACQEVKLDFTQ
ncbi:LOW QUALITY PROTEIN: interferon-induced protein 44 [Spinachia spinachia]